MKVASTKLSNPEWDALQNKCNERGVTIAEHLRDLIRTDSNKTPIREGEQAGREKEPMMENNKHPEPAPASSLALLLGKRPSATSNAQSESSSTMDDMMKQVSKQGVLIQRLFSLIWEMGIKVNEQKKEYARSVRMQSPSSKPSCRSLSEVLKPKGTLAIL